MAVHESHPGAMAPRPTGNSSTETTQPYTGVVLIHGIGDIKRNDMLQQVVDALSYWLNHEAGFALRSEGPGRLWLTTELIEEDNPDARASRATIDLVAPTGPAGGGTELRLDIREVWWAGSAGRHGVATTIRWARVQWREQWAHLLIPVGRRLGPAHAAARAPARETSQALTYRPPLPAGEGPGVRSPEPLDARLQRGALRAGLALYETFQYVWKALQWLILTPAIALLLLVMGVVQVLAIVPFLEPAVLAGLGAITDRIMLHWVAEVQVYLLDYTRGSSIRQRFEREVDAFLRDPACARVVVIAHSMGAAIAYEGLTTALAQPDMPDAHKPVTFISVGPALRRAWLMADADPHRMHGVLPERVRWVNFWARYDPVAAGPLSARSLPPLDDWDDPARPNPHAAICASLGRCENVDVANTDSSLFDHTAYWDNLEQVVGPIARELVADHPALEPVVSAHLAGADDVLRRRGRLAWRATVSVLGGLVAGALFLLWDHSNRQPTSRLPFGFGHGLLEYGPGIVGRAIGNIGPVGTLLGLVGSAWNISPFALGLQSVAGPHGALPRPVVDGAASVVAALAVAGLGMLGIGRLVAPPSPLDLTGAPKDAGTPRSIPVLAGISLVLLTLGIAPVTSSTLGLGPFFQAVQHLAGTPSPGWVSTATFYLAAVLGGVSVLLSLVDTARRQRWGWFLVLLLVTLAFVLPISSYAGAQPIVRQLPGEVPAIGPVAAELSVDVVATAGGICLVGAILGAIQTLHDRRWGQVAGPLLLVIALPAPVIAAMLPTTKTYLSLYGFGIEPYVAAFLPVLIYGLWSDPARGAKDRTARSDANALPNASILRLGSSAVVLGFLASYIPYFLYLAYHWYPRRFELVVAYGSLAIDALLAGGGAALALTSLGHARRWGWLIAVVAVPLSLAGGLIVTYPISPKTGPPFVLLAVFVILVELYLPAVLVGLALWVAPVGAAKGTAVPSPTAR